MALTKIGKEGITGISNSSDANAITIDSSEKVGIGGSPSTPLHVQASGQNAHIRLQASDDGYASRLQLYANNVSGASFNAIQSHVNGDSTIQWEISGPKASAEDQMLFHTGGTERMRIASDGKVTLTQQIAAKAPTFRATMSAGQTFTTSTFTVAAFNSEVWDSNSNYDTGTYRFTPTVAGYYHFTVQIFASVSTNRAMTGFRKNGSSDTETWHIGSAAGGGVCYQSDAIIQLNGSTDYVEAQFYHEQGSNTTCNSNPALTNFAGHLLMAT